MLNLTLNVLALAMLTFSVDANVTENEKSTEIKLKKRQEQLKNCKRTAVFSDI